MNDKLKLNEIWIKAAVLGTIWASSEIVFGSFLHNLRIPFSGNILTGIGIIILVAAGHIWNEKGLFWRAGVITALLKTMSPSAVIFGPMVAIIAEAFLIEFSTRLFGRKVFAFFLGAMLAMSWNLFQKIFNYIIFYGYNIVELYKSLVELARASLNFESELFWLPVLALFVIYALLGAAAAYIGVGIGRRLVNKPAEIVDEFVPAGNPESFRFSEPDFNYSFYWLVIDLILIVTALILLNYCNWIIWTVATILIAAVWAARYKRALRQLAKPKFWISFAVITMLAALIFNNGAVIANGLMTGLEMNFRAVVIIMGFSVLGTELYNPRIRELFLKSNFRQLATALELSLESLPKAIANMPDLKLIIKNPFEMLYRIIAQAELRLNEIKNKRGKKRKIFIVTGSVGQGKTSCIKRTVELLRQKNISAGGIYSVRLMTGNITTGYDLVDLKSGEQTEFLRDAGREGFDKIGKYFISPDGLQKGNEIIYRALDTSNSFVIIDEIGKLELKGGGWAGALEEMLNLYDKNILISVRDSFTQEVIKKWELKNAEVFNVAVSGPEKIAAAILEKAAGI